MKHLTREQQLFLAVTVFLLLTGLAVKVWRTSHPPHRDSASTSAAQSNKR